MKLARRRLLYSLVGAALLPAGTGVYAWRIEPHWIEFVHRDLPLHGLPSGLENKTLVQISDLHVGPKVDSQYLINTLQALNRLNPDMLVITGDFVSYRSAEQFGALARVLEHLPSTSLGAYGVLGNHDYGHGWKNESVAEQIVQRAVDSGITMLRNEIIDIMGLPLAGLDDFWGPRFSPETTFSRLEHSQDALILSHNPDSADHPAMASVQGWILSGHTHGGQCKAPFLPPPILPVKNKRYAAGEVIVSEGIRLYINRGLGHLARVRFNVRPEVTVFTLKILHQ